jgi:hypothetical protein
MDRSLIPCLALCLVLVAPGAASAFFPTAQLQYSSPLRLGGEFGFNFYDFVGFSPTLTNGGPFVTVSGGRDGIGLNLGMKGTITFMIPLATGGIGPSGLYLWDDEDASYAGVRLIAGMKLVSFFGGAYRRISGDREDDWLFSLGAGIGMP